MAEAAPELGVFECDESYFGGVRKGKRGRGAAGKACVFGILKRGGKVHALPVADPSSRTLLTALKTRVLADSLVYTDSLPSYNFLDIAGFRHRRVNHSKTLSPNAATTSTASRISGTSPSACCANTTASDANISSCSPRNASSVSIMAHSNGSLPP
jgi:transposase-like protein